MARIRKSYYLPWVLLLACAVFFVYENGSSLEVLKQYRSYIITYIIIIVALFLVLRKKEQMEDERNKDK
jgi:membrane protein DedA with SNARE-associated domain